MIARFPCWSSVSQPMIKGRAFHALALELVRINNEASLRSAISRFYYGAYLELRSYYEKTQGFNRTKMRMEHQAIHDLLNKTEPLLAKRLKTLRELRNRADYDIEADEDVINIDAQSCSDFSTEIINWVDKQLASHQR